MELKNGVGNIRLLLTMLKERIIGKKNLKEGQHLNNQNQSQHQWKLD